MAKKYDPLIDHLRSATEDTLVLSFSDIEGIIQATLPDTALGSPTWWANSRTNDSHTWSHEWQAAGWRAQAKLSEATVTFTRSGPRNILDDLKPRRRNTVMSLVKKAEISVDAWAFSDSGPVEKPQSNPNFCFNWSFGSHAEGYVLCAWHEHLREQNGQVIFDCDVGTLVQRLRDELTAGGLSGDERHRMQKQLARAEAFVTILRVATPAGLPLRLILNTGNLRSYADLKDESSKVSFRLLDNAFWYVHSFEDGNAVLIRGVPRADLASVETKDDEPPTDPGEDDVWRLGQIRVRRGQGEFRKRLLAAYGMKCAVTGTEFADILEAAHIIPHVQGTDYRESNGLLLRADIHTLYDLHHLSVDGRGCIHLSRTARKSGQYAYLHHRQIEYPAKFAHYPSAASLDSRHRRFEDCEKARPV